MAHHTLGLVDTSAYRATSHTTFWKSFKMPVCMPAETAPGNSPVQNTDEEKTIFRTIKNITRPPLWVRFLLLMIGLGGATASISATPFPYFTDFEIADGYTLGPVLLDPLWVDAPGLSLSISDIAFEGEQSLSYEGASWLRFIQDEEDTTSGFPVTWVDFYLRPVFSDLLDLPAANAADPAVFTGFVKVSSLGEVYALDGDGENDGEWIGTGILTALDGNDRALDWMRITYRIDFLAKRWDLYVDGGLTLIDLGFTDDTWNAFTGFSLWGDASAAGFLDSFYTGGINPLFADSNNDGIPDDWASTHGLSGLDAGRDADPDGDGIPNILEYLSGTAPNHVVTAPPLSGLRLWLRADQGVPSSGAVAVWEDQSGNANHATQTESDSQPSVVVSSEMNGRPAIRFDGVDDYYNLPNIMAGATQGEIFIVNRLQDFTNTYNGLCQFGVQNGVAYSQDNDDYIWEDFGIDEGAPFSGPGSATLLSTHIYNASITEASLSTVRFDGRIIKIRQGTQVDFITTPLLGNDNYNEFYRGDVAEVLVFERALTNVERALVYAYLYGKYAPPGMELPGAPILSAHVLASTAADLNWSVASGAYQHLTATLERQTAGGGFTTIATLENEASYTDSTLVPETTYDYRVKLASYAGESDYSAVVSFTTPATVALPSTAGLRVWLRSTAGLTSEAAVADWLDQSGHGNHASQGYEPHRPSLVSNAMNGLPAIRFDGQQDRHLQLPENLMSDAIAGEAFIVLRRDLSYSGVSGLWSFSSHDGSRYPEYNNQIQDSFASNQWTEAPDSPINLEDPHVYNVGGDTTEWFQNLNNVRYATRTGNTVAWRSDPVIGVGLNVGVSFAGDMAEILIYDRVLTQEERAEVNHYLSTRYPMGWSVPDESPPTTPDRPNAISLSATAIRLDWAPSSDDSAVYNYRIYQGGTLIGESRLPTFDVEGLQSGMLYEFRVQAVDLVGRRSALSEKRGIYLSAPWPYGNSSTSDFDGDEVPDIRDADPANPSVGELTITIESPLSGSSVN